MTSIVKWWERVKCRPWYIRLSRWEYWPMPAFYWPMLVYGPLLALRARHPCFFTAANPGILTGGLGLESKFQTLGRIPAQWRPKTVRIHPAASFRHILEELGRAGIDFPLIAKPDVGYRGLLVRKINSAAELAAYLRQYPVAFLLQEYLDYPEEISVLYYRYPGAGKGHISSVTFKEFLYVVGDGKSTVAELVIGNPRALLQLDRLQETQQSLLHELPPKGQRVSLGVVGNHSKGTRFINANRYIDEQLVRTFDHIAGSIDGFYYGRFDLKCRHFADLRLGKSFKIIEVNGVCSEPTHIYDPGRITYAGALRAILQHWRIIFRIASLNHRRGIPYMRPGAMIRLLARWRAYLERIA